VGGANRPGKGQGAATHAKQRGGEYTNLIHQADIVTDQGARAKLYEQAQVVFHDELPSMMFADVQGFIGVRDNVQGFKLHFLGGQPFGGVGLAK